MGVQTSSKVFGCPGDDPTPETKSKLAPEN